MRLTRLIPLAAALSALGLGGAGNANAEAYALSFQDIQNGALTFNPFPGDAVPPPVVNVSSSSQAQLNGATDAGDATDPTDAGPANAPGSSVTRVDNVFNRFGPGNTDFSNSDAQIVTQQITNPDGSVAQPFRAINIAESDVGGNSDATADANNGSLTGINFQFNIASATTVTLAFDNDPFMRAFITPDAEIGASATAGIKATATLTDPNGMVVFSWSPNGTGSAFVDNSGTNTIVVDEADLNRNLPNAAPGSDFIYDPRNGIGVVGNPCAGGANLLCNYAIDVVLGPNNGGTSTIGQASGVYSLDLQMEETTDVASIAVPEPTTLGLMGLGLLGMGFARRVVVTRKA